MKIGFPAQNIPIQTPNGDIDPLWYDKLKALEAFVNLFSQVDPNSFTDGYTLVWSAAQKQFLPGAN